jgi:putative ABC transport system ATP-binding protein
VSCEELVEPRKRLELVQLEVDLNGHAVLAGIDLVVDGGRPVALTGPSGSGKTVLCLVLAGALVPTRGQVLLNGRPFCAGGTSIGLILQSHGLADGLTAEENVALPLQARGLSRAEIGRRSTRALASVGLGGLETRRIEELSGGEHQRVGIARALAGDPAVLIADEPTSELDPENRQIVLGLLLDHAAKSNIVVVASDDPDVVATFPQVVELDRGQMKHNGHQPEEPDR